jgi:hypothetical protein
VEMGSGRIAGVAWHRRGVACNQVRRHELVPEFGANPTLLLWQQPALRYINALAAGDPRTKAVRKSYPSAVGALDFRLGVS